MPYYVQIDAENRVYAVSQLAGEMDQPDLIPIDNYDEGLLGKIYDPATGEFNDPVEPPA